MSLPLLGIAPANHTNQNEEDDLKDQSTKRVKRGYTSFSLSSMLPLVYEENGYDDVG